MKPLLIALCCAVALFAFVSIGIADFNPHDGLRVVSMWNHKGLEKDGVHRLIPPQRIRDSLAQMRDCNIFTTDGSRCSIPEVRAVCNDGKKALADPENVAYWDIVEIARFDREAIAGTAATATTPATPAGFRLKWSESSVHQPLDEWFLTNGNYLTKSFWNDKRARAELFPHGSAMNDATLANVIRVVPQAAVEFAVIPDKDDFERDPKAALKSESDSFAINVKSKRLAVGGGWLRPYAGGKALEVVTGEGIYLLPLVETGAREVIKRDPFKLFVSAVCFAVLGYTVWWHVEHPYRRTFQRIAVDGEDLEVTTDGRFSDKEIRQSLEAMQAEPDKLRHQMRGRLFQFLSEAIPVITEPETATDVEDP